MLGNENDSLKGDKKDFKGDTSIGAGNSSDKAVSTTETNQRPQNDISYLEALVYPALTTGSVLALVCCIFYILPEALDRFVGVVTLVIASSLISGGLAKKLLNASEYSRFLNSIFATSAVLFLTMYWVVDFDKVKRKYLDDPITAQFYFNAEQIERIPEGYSEVQLIFDDHKGKKIIKRADIVNGNPVEFPAHFQDFKKVYVDFCIPGKNICAKSQNPNFGKNERINIIFDDENLPTRKDESGKLSFTRD